MRKFGLTANQLKLLAAAFMVCDHVGVHIVYPLMGSASVAYIVLRAIGRIAFPIFAYFIAEGCAHTKNRARYFIMMLICAVIAETIFGVAGAVGFNVTTLSIFTTFCIAIAAIYLFDACIKMAKAKNVKYCTLFGAAFICVLAGALLVEILAQNKLIALNIEYGFFGVLTIVIVYLLKNKYIKLTGFAVGQVGIALVSSFSLQFYSLFSVPLMLLYNGKRGKWRMKYFFYIFYPAHIVVILVVGIIIGVIKL